MNTTLTPERSQTPPRRRRRRLVVAAIVVVLLLVAIAVAGIVYFFSGDDPSEANLPNAVAQAEAEASITSVIDVDDTAATDATVGAATPDTTATAAATTGIEGTWAVDTSIGEFNYEDSTGTFVGFRVNEELAGIGSATAVGRTPDVTGAITIDGTTLTAATIEADMTTITTNDGRRDDNVLRALEVTTFPTATFVLTQPVELGAAAATGEAIEVAATGELTIHGVTTAATIPLQAQLVNGVVVVVGSIDITFADYGVSVPSAPVVVSAEDTGILELQLFLAPT